MSFNHAVNVFADLIPVRCKNNMDRCTGGLHGLQCRNLWHYMYRIEQTWRAKAFNESSDESRTRQVAEVFLHGVLRTLTLSLA
ncbi:hypothetical protein R11007_04732 [Ralstonia holmesii]|nr:hypothetical protein R11007_04732 [Ralstonia sp. LMG 32967]